MTTITRRMLGASASALLLAASLAAAQTPETVRVRGTIETVDGPILNIKARDGAMLKLKLAENAPVRAVVKASLGDIKVGSYLAITSVAQPDGGQKALAVLILPEALRGVAEGSIPWDFVPNSRMTNATVESTVASVDGQLLVVKYRTASRKSSSRRAPRLSPLHRRVRPTSSRAKKYSSSLRKSFLTARWRHRMCQSAITASGGEVRNHFPG